MDVLGTRLGFDHSRMGVGHLASLGLLHRDQQLDIEKLAVIPRTKMYSSNTNRDNIQ